MKFEFNGWFNGSSLDLQPPNENGWFWSGSGVKVGPTTQRNTGDWSYTGGYNQAQPDNREAAQVSAISRLIIDLKLTFSFIIQGNDESCLSILNNFYNDGLKWVRRLTRLTFHFRSNSIVSHFPFFSFYQQHDVACYHLKPFVCEDSDELLNFVRSRNPGLKL